MYLHAGKENKVENNLFLDTSKEIAKFRRWREEKEYETLRTRGVGLRHNEIRRNVIASGVGANNVLYRFDTSLDKDGRLLSFEAWLSLGYERGSVEADRRFALEGEHPYALRPDSPAFAMGFEPLPFERMGPRRDIEEVEGVREHPVR